MNKKNHGFTLVELLVVVAVIGILVSIAVPISFNVRNEARIATARAMVMNIASAVEGYFQEYGRLPDLTDSKDIIKVLVGRDDINNPRKIQFLSMQQLDDVPTNWDGEYLDPWQNQYEIWLDDDYDGIVEPDSEDWKVEGIVAVRSKGNDKIAGTKNDILSAAPID